MDFTRSAFASAEGSSSTTVLRHAARKRSLNKSRIFPKSAFPSALEQNDVPSPHVMEEKVYVDFDPSEAQPTTHLGEDLEILVLQIQERSSEVIKVIPQE